MSEMRIVSRVEWFAIASRNRPGVPGFSPMWQLQWKIRNNPLTFAVELMGVFRTTEGSIVERIIPWPPSKWRIGKTKLNFRGQVARKGMDLHPYRIIDPIMDELEDHMARYGEDHEYTITTARKLLRVCLKDFGYGQAI